MSSLLLLAALAIDFNGQVKPVLEQRCNQCHDAAFYKRNKDTMAMRVNLPADNKMAMPPGGARLTEAQKAALAAWVAEGAVYPEAPKAMADDLALTRRLRAEFLKNKAEAALLAYKETIPGTGVSFEMMPVPGGKFQMGTPEGEAGRKDDEGPVHERTIEPFWMGKHEVTWNEYRLFMFASIAGEKAGENVALDAVSRPTKPYVEMSFGMGIEGFPAISMTHHAANKYAQWLSARTGHFYRLPTEAEWEYACRAGKTEQKPLEEFAISRANSKERYELVGSRKPNALGLFDMLGNVMEWTVDQYEADAYARPRPLVPSKTPYPHVARGGSWMEDASALRCGARTASDPSWKMQDPNLPKSIWYHTDAQGLGMRLVRPLKIPSPEEMHAFWNNGVAEDQ
jgi:formylglycine-generating enzyme required for sulfatase activity